MLASPLFTLLLPLLLATGGGAFASYFDCLEVGFDYEGAVLLLVDDVASAAQCQRLCAYHPGCVYFTFGSGPEEAKRDKCWLKREEARQFREEQERR